MTANDLTVDLLVRATPEEVFEAIGNVKGWWSEDFRGQSRHQGDAFDVRFGNVHFSAHTVIESVPGSRVVWSVTDSCLNFLKDKTEWTGTEIVFDILEEEEGTRLRLTHIGLRPGVECFADCFNGWNHFVHKSLALLINEGKGNPNVLNAEVKKKEASIQ